MAIIKCKMCGGDLEVVAESSVAVCEYCGTQQTVPSADNEKKLTLFGRANRLRMACEFDKAAGVYESIVADFPEEAEAYWGLVLCKYGIEYVDDPATGKKIPTCHRSSFDSVMDDSNLEQALENADAIARRVYRDEAKAIEELRKGIIEVSGKEEPYDIFICYKETDDSGDRTIDSVIAQEVYDALTEKGYRVFFSRITLEDKLGQEYEPYIFAALHSAKIMLAFGTDYEYYNAVWVKNEWSRFLQLIAAGEKKTLIPCYKNIDAYDMPKEFARLQAQDMGKVGAMQDLLRGIEKILPREKAVVKETVVVQQSAETTKVQAMLERAFLFLEDGDWKAAEEYCEKALDIDPKCAEAYVGKLMVDLRVKKQEDLANCAEPFDENPNYQKAIRFADDKLRAALTGVIDSVKVRKEIVRKDEILAAAEMKMEGNTIANYEQAIDLLMFIPGWKDANDKLAVCRRAIEELKENQELARKKAEEKTKKAKKIGAIAAVLAIVAVLVAIVVVKEVAPNIKYNNAVKLMGKGQYEKAIAVFESLGEHKDSETMILEAKYALAVASLNKKDPKNAIAIFEELGSYNDSSEKIKEAEIMLVQYSNLNVSEDGIVKFGTYEQDNNKANGKEEIEWLVLDVEDNRALVISKYAIDCKRYNTSRTDTTWETCSLREWLNNDFINSAFSANEKELIPTVTVSVGTNLQRSTDPGNPTQDKVFLLSMIEARAFFDSDRERECKPTDYAIANGVWESPSGNSKWWLRTPGAWQISAVSVGGGGAVNGDSGDIVNENETGVRPAMWIDLGA